MAETASFTEIPKDTPWAAAVLLLNRQLPRVVDLLRLAARYEIRDITSSTALTLGLRQLVVRADASAAPITVTLPDVRLCAERALDCKRMNSGANAVTIAAMGGQTIDNSASLALSTQYAHVRIVSDGATWTVI